MKATLNSRILCVVIVVLAILAPGVLRAEKSEISEYLDAWVYHNRGETKQALRAIKKFNPPNSEYEGWAILLGAIYTEGDRYQEALDSIKKVRPKVEQLYQAIEKKQITVAEDTRELVRFNYHKMLITSGLANFKLENWSEALNDLLAYSKEHHETYIYEYIGVCFYKMDQHSNAIAFLKRSFQLHEEGELKDTAAFNVGALNALLGNVDEAISWLKIPLEHNRKLWLEKIQTDKDFDSVRKNEKFKEFLRQQEKRGSRDKGDKIRGTLEHEENGDEIIRFS